MRLTLNVEPFPKARARTVVKNGRVMSFTPKATQDAESAIRTELLEVGQFFEGGTPLSVQLRFTITRPPSAPKRRAHPVTRPDMDNYIKLVLDAANGYLWADDSQVCRLAADKVYGSPPAIEIEVSEISD